MPSNGLAKLQKLNPLICDQPSKQFKLHWLVSHIPSNNDCGGGNFGQKLKLKLIIWSEKREMNGTCRVDEWFLFGYRKKWECRKMREPLIKEHVYANKLNKNVESSPVETI